MHFHFTSVKSSSFNIKQLVYVVLLRAAFVFISGTTSRAILWLNSHLFIMISAVTHLCYNKEFLAYIAFEGVEIWPDLPVNFFPGYSVCFSHISDKLLQIPLFIYYMLCSLLSIFINVNFPFRTTQNISLLFSKKSQTVSTFVKIILIFF